MRAEVNPASEQVALKFPYFRAKENEAWVFDPLNFGKLIVCIFPYMQPAKAPVVWPFTFTAETEPVPLMMKSMSTL